MATITLTDTDVRVRDAVLRQLEWEPEVDASAVGVAVPVPRHVAQRAQRQHLAARRVLANNELQRDHGPLTRYSTSA